jgi:hypothetical protein
MTDTILARFHEALVGALRERDPDQLSRPFTVAEVYQDLVPYGAYRDILGVEMNGDYEHALLRLLAGEGDFVELESEHALREIQEELESVNPNTGLYREFAAVDVRLNPSKIPPADEVPVETEAEEPAAILTGERAGFEMEADISLAEDGDDAKVVPLGAFTTTQPFSPELVEGSLSDPDIEAQPVHLSNADTDVCRWCRETLPKRDNLNFCPFCGTDSKLVPCDSCGEALEPDWRFCIACGSRASED